MELDELDYVGMGKRIRHFRQQLKLTQGVFAEQIDVSPSFVGHLERGTRKASLATLFRISQVLRQPLDIIVGGFYIASRQEKSTQIQTRILSDIAMVLGTYMNEQQQS